jgi:hypothetical protein
MRLAHRQPIHLHPSPPLTIVQHPPVHSQKPPLGGGRGGRRPAPPPTANSTYLQNSCVQEMDCRAFIHRQCAVAAITNLHGCRVGKGGGECCGSQDVLQASKLPENPQRTEPPSVCALMGCVLRRRSSAGIARTQVPRRGEGRGGGGIVGCRGKGLCGKILTHT